MMTIAAARRPGMFHVVCNNCLWYPGHALPESEAFAAADRHRAECTNEPPAFVTTAQINKARKIISGDY